MMAVDLTQHTVIYTMSHFLSWENTDWSFVTVEK